MPSIGDKLDAILAEYNTLRSEILQRSEFQNRFVQIHIVALTSIIGFTFYQGLKLWALFLIPIESSLFGLWYLDQNIMCIKIGEYIQTSIEPRVSTLLNEINIMNWESYLGCIFTTKHKDTKVYRLSNVLTFGGPSVLILLTTLAFFLINKQNFYDIFQVPPIYALIGWSSGSVSTICLFLSMIERSDLRSERQKRFEKWLEPTSEDLIIDYLPEDGCIKIKNPSTHRNIVVKDQRLLGPLDLLIQENKLQEFKGSYKGKGYIISRETEDRIRITLDGSYVIVKDADIMDVYIAIANFS